MRTTGRDGDFFGKRPNWVLKHPAIYGNAYHQAVYTHLRGMNPRLSWKSERELTGQVSTETGFGLSTCRKSYAVLKKSGLVTLSSDGFLTFEDDPTRVLRDTEGGSGCSQSGSGGSQSGYTQSHFTPSDLPVCDTRSVDQIEIELEGIGTNVPIPFPEGNFVHEEEPVILGADTEVPEPPKGKTPNLPLQVYDYFNFVARKMNSVPITDVKDRVAFLAQMKRSLNSGLTVQSLMGMIDRFFQYDRNRQHRYPWKIFVMKETQQKLLSTATAVRIEDEVLDWIGRDFSRSQPLPWDESFDEFFQTLVQRRGMVLAYRYPDLLSQIAKVASGDRTLAQNLVSSASSLITNYLNDNTADDELAELKNAGITLPTDLSPRRIRKEALTLQEAVLTASRRNQ